MAIKNFRIRPEGGNDFADTLHPETNTGMVLDKDGNPMLHDYVRFPGYSIATGTNNYVASLDPAPFAYKEGMRVAIKIGSANTEKATLNINNLGVKPIVDPEGEELEAGDLLANQVYNLIYTGTVFQLLGKGGDNVELTGNAFASQVLKDRTFYNTDPNNKLVGTMKNNGSVSSTITITGAGKPTKTIPQGYTSGGTITARLSSTLASSIKKGTTIGGVTGTFKGGWNVTTGSLYDADDRNRVTKTISGYKDDTGAVEFRVDVPGITSTSTVHAVIISYAVLDNITESEYEGIPWHWSNAIYRGSGNLPSLYVSGIRLNMNNVTSSTGYINIYYDWEIKYRDGRLNAEVEMYGSEGDPILVIWS